MKLHWNPIILGMTLAMGILGCTPEKQKSMTDQEIAIAWAEMTTYLMKYTPANSPTYASRTAGYIGLTMYESIVHGYPEYQSLAGQLNGLEDLPMPESGVEYSWPASMNAAQSAILQQVYNQTSDKNKQMIDSLESLIAKNITSRGIESDVIERSADFGRAISDAIFEWSKTDGGHRGYLNNFDKEFEHKVFPGSWKPPLYAQSFSHHPLHPYWGKNRTFLAENAEIPLPDMIPYDTTKGSPYYQQFLAVYEKEQTLTREEKETALWWGDDPSDTFTPPGHSYYLATLV
ncbi:MAG: phosphoesterase, partial [Bacteroidetes bacterium]|nr:phosphoesterase [Bacteroidota bacterium]